MKLLFDQNLSPRLPHLLADIYAESTHVREVALHEATDLTIWQFAQANGYVIVSKDSDFQQRSLLQRCTAEVHLVASWELHVSEN